MKPSSAKRRLDGPSLCRHGNDVGVGVRARAASRETACLPPAQDAPARLEAPRPAACRPASGARGLCADSRLPCDPGSPAEIGHGRLLPAGRETGSRAAPARQELRPPLPSSFPGEPCRAGQGRQGRRAKRHRASRRVADGAPPCAAMDAARGWVAAAAAAACCMIVLVRTSAQCMGQELLC